MVEVLINMVAVEETTNRKDPFFFLKEFIYCLMVILLKNPTF